MAKTVRLPVTASIIRLVITSMAVAPEIYVHLVGRAGAAAWVGSILLLLAFYHVIKFYITYIRLKVLLSLYTVNKKAGTIKHCYILYWCLLQKLYMIRSLTVVHFI